MNKNNKKLWRKEKLKKITLIGSEVTLPFDEEGVIIDYVNWRLDWFPFKIKIINGNFNCKGEIIEFKKEQIIFKNKKLNELFK